MNQINSVRSKKDNINSNDVIEVFFENHPTTRKIVAYAPIIILGGANTIERFSSYKLLPEPGALYMISLSVMFFFQGFAMSCERSMQNKKIERLN